MVNKYFEEHLTVLSFDILVIGNGFPGLEFQFVPTNP